MGVNLLATLRVWIVFPILMVATSATVDVVAAGSEVTASQTAGLGAEGSWADWIRVPELRAFAEGRVYEEVATKLVNVLAYLPQSSSHEQGFLANIGPELGVDIYLIPIGGRISEHDRAMIRASRCEAADRAFGEQMSSALYFSVADGSERACVAVRTSVVSTIQLLELLRKANREGCLDQLRFTKAMYADLIRNEQTLNRSKTQEIQRIVEKALEADC